MQYKRLTNAQRQLNRARFAFKVRISTVQIEQNLSRQDAIKVVKAEQARRKGHSSNPRQISTTATPGTAR